MKKVLEGGQAGEKNEGIANLSRCTRAVVSLIVDYLDKRTLLRITTIGFVLIQRTHRCQLRSSMSSDKVSKVTNLQLRTTVLNILEGCLINVLALHKPKTSRIPFRRGYNGISGKDSPMVKYATFWTV